MALGIQAKGHRERNRMTPILLRLAADTALVAVALFASAGTPSWWRGWILIGVMLLIRIPTAVVVHRVSPALARERAKLPIHAGQPWVDKVLLIAVLITGFLGLPVVSGLDVFHWHILPRPHSIVEAVGLIVFAAGWAIKGVALKTNAFATTVVRLQNEREHVVIDSGPYSVVRHPFYAGTPLVFIGMSLWLGSYAAAIGAVVPIALMTMRLQMEERFLRQELPGYTDYATRVRHRLVPGIW